MSTDSHQTTEQLKQMVDYFSLLLRTAKGLGDKVGEATTCENLGNVFHGLRDFKKAVEYHKLALNFAKDLGDKAGEGRAYGNLGSSFYHLGDSKKAVVYYNLCLRICKDLGDRFREGITYGNLGLAFQHLCEFKKAIDFFRNALSFAKDLGDKVGERHAYIGLGNCFQSLCDFKRAINYHNLSLKMAKDLKDKAGEGIAYCNLGISFECLGDFKNASDYYYRDLNIAKDLGDKAGEGASYGNLGNVFYSLNDFKKAVYYYNLRLKIAKDLGGKAGEGRAYGNLCNVFQSLGDFEKALYYVKQRLSIAKDIGDKEGEGAAYSELGNTFTGLGDFKKAANYHSLSLSILRSLGDKVGQGREYGNLGKCFYYLGDFKQAEEYYQSSVSMLNEVRSLLRSEDKWKIDFRNEFNACYIGLWKTLLEQEKLLEALFAADEGRAQALTDLMESQYVSEAYLSGSRGLEANDIEMMTSSVSSTVFLAIRLPKLGISAWVLSKGEPVYHRKKELDDNHAKDGASAFHSLIESTYKNIGVRSDVKCEDRSLDALWEDFSTDERSVKKSLPPLLSKENPLATLYNYVIGPIADLAQADELVIVADGPLWLAPFHAFLDPDSKYLCESYRIRLIPSLTSLKMISYSPPKYHSRSGALLVGDPCVADITNDEGKRMLEQLPFARKEVEMIGQILKVTPLTGKKATKDMVLKELSSVALVHIAAHGHMETGEIALSPNPRRLSRAPLEEDYLLTMADVMRVKLRARLVVLSCCHSGRGHIKAEGVVGIARAFMGAGARSVLVSLWAIDDEATLEFMRSFYHHLVKGRSACKSLNQAVKSLRESDKYSDVKYWAPFVLIGDDATLSFDENE